jgi:hypothetical protein
MAAAAGPDGSKPKWLESVGLRPAVAKWIAKDAIPAQAADKRKKIDIPAIKPQITVRLFLLSPA